MILAWLVQCIILSGYVWFDKFRIPDESYSCWLIRGMRGFIFIFFTVISLIMIDTNVKLLMGVAGYGNITLHLASVILTFILVAEIIIGAVFVAPNRKGIITFAAVLSLFIYLSQFYLIDADPNELDLFGTKYSALIVIIVFPILVGIIVAITLTIIELIFKKIKSEREVYDKPFWNIQEKAKNIFSFRFNFILWALLTAELILNLEGMSLLLWLTIFF